MAPCRSNILAALQSAATRPKEVNALGSDAPTLRITRQRPQIRLDSIPDFLHQFLPEGHTKGPDQDSSKAVALPHLLEVLTVSTPLKPSQNTDASRRKLLHQLCYSRTSGMRGCLGAVILRCLVPQDLSQGVPDDAAFLATVNDIAKQEGIAL
ncbi:hypothetical protein Emed_001398 [Eimeria media]